MNPLAVPYTVDEVIGAILHEARSRSRILQAIIPESKVLPYGAPARWLAANTETFVLLVSATLCCANDNPDNAEEPIVQLLASLRRTLIEGGFRSNDERNN